MPQEINTADATSLQSRIIEKIKEKGYTMPSQRLAIINALCILNIATDPDDLWMYLRRKQVKVSIGAVYFNLNLLVKEELLSKIPKTGRSYSYLLAKEF